MITQAIAVIGSILLREQPLSPEILVPGLAMKLSPRHRHYALIRVRLPDEDSPTIDSSDWIISEGRLSLDLAAGGLMQLKEKQLPKSNDTKVNPYPGHRCYCHY